MIAPVLRSAALAGAVALAAAADTRPNVLFYLVDDLGARDLGCYGSASYATPAIDELAAGGVRCTSGYSSYARCVPSRFSMLTGINPARAIAGKANDVTRFTTTGGAFAKAGYRTMFIGKWHMGDGARAPTACGFERSYAAGDAGATHSQIAPYNATGPAKGGKGKEEAPIPDVDDAPAGEYLADRLTDAAISFVQEGGDRPFFAVLSHYAVHTPIQGPPALVPEAKARIDALGLSGPGYEPEGAGENKLLQDNAQYAAMVASVDRNLARLRAALAAKGLDRNTIIVFASDHGGLSARGGNKRELATSNRPLRAGKGHLYEGGIRIPLIVSGPGVRPGTCDRPIVGYDIPNLMLGLAGLPAIPASEAPDIAWPAALASQDDGPGRDLIWHNNEPRPGSTGDTWSSAIRAGRWKLLDFYADKRVELYDLAADPGESRDLAASDPAQTAALKARLDAWRTAAGADMQVKEQGGRKERKAGNGGE